MRIREATPARPHLQSDRWLYPVRCTRAQRRDEDAYRPAGLVQDGFPAHRSNSHSGSPKPRSGVVWPEYFDSYPCDSRRHGQDASNFKPVGYTEEGAWLQLQSFALLPKAHGEFQQTRYALFSERLSKLFSDP